MTRVLVTGWPSLHDGEATAGDVLAMNAVADALGAEGIGCDLAWSPVLRPDGLTLEAADPAAYTHLVFACGPLSGPGVAALHERFRACRRIAAGVSVPDPADPAAAGFDVILARDGPGIQPGGDLSAGQPVRDVPVAGVVLVDRQSEYGGRARHEPVAASLEEWLRGCGCARIPLDTRLDPRDWRLAREPDELVSVIGRLDLVVTMRLHGLVLALRRGVPAIAVDPVAGGAKVSSQARAWRWPAVLRPGADGRLDPGMLDRWRDWCLSPAGRSAAGDARPLATPLSGLLDELAAPVSAGGSG